MREGVRGNLGGEKWRGGEDKNGRIEEELKWQDVTFTRVKTRHRTCYALKIEFSEECVPALNILCL